MANEYSRIQEYLAGVDRLEARVGDMLPDQLRARPIPGRWSTLEVVCHLVDSEMIYADRIKRIIAEDEPTLVYADETRWVERLCSHERNLQEELSLLKLVRNQVARILRHVPAEAFERKGLHTKAGPLTLHEIFERGAAHLDHHLPFIDQKRAALGLPAVK